MVPGIPEPLGVSASIWPVCFPSVYLVWFLKNVKIAGMLWVITVP
jgi:hypothetical protein